MDFNDIKIRCSSIGYIMTEPKTKKDKDAGKLSETCVGHLSDIYVRAKYGRQTDTTNKYTLKGNMVEEDSLTLYSRYKGRIFFKNKDRIENEFIIGSPDIIDGQTIIDIKSSWDIFTFFRNNEEKINNQYYWQMQGYMALTGSTKAILAYCLVNTPDSIIADEKRKLFYKMNVATMENEEYLKCCEDVERLAIYDDIPLNEKVIELSIDRCNEDIDAIYAKVSKCREFMKSKYGSLTMFTHDSSVKAVIVERM